ncbi:hypothetical protein GCM10010441_60040 [Kitasatospora paracochleata]|uniref:WD40 repeat protein n=1 Tax=Kitasatospora paracochleata TaxID=58354 RepID=A0ABT1IV90_9ACTN|nr:hypothetical protein [Kitasatospora paracochleata]MCP2309051.1 hypothetical protein [Kitasatospora paracochleata]
MADEDQWVPSFEETVGDAFSVVAEEFRPAAGPRLEEVMVQGRALRRRRAAAVAGSVTALAVIGVGGVFASGLRGPARPVASVDGAPASATVSAPPSPSVSKPPNTTLQEVVDNLGRLLGPHATVNPVRPPKGVGSDASSQLYADGVLDDGHGKAAFAVEVERRPDGDTQPSDLVCPDPALVPNDGCTSIRQPDGSTLVLLKGYEYPDKRVLTKSWDAHLYGPDGLHLFFTESNSARSKDAPITRPEPPLDFDRLTALLTDPSWQPLLARVARPLPLAQRPDAQPPGSEVLTVAAGLLPAGLTELDATSQTGLAVFDVDDGQGRSEVQLLVTKQPTGTPDRRYVDATPLPDGSRLLVDRSVGGGVVRWSAEVLQPDGTRVVAAAFNTPAPHGKSETEADRATPALTMDQLTAIASSPVWRQHNGRPAG